MAVEPPIVYVKEPLAWEYKDLARDLNDGDTLSVDELNNLGKEGWELAGVFAASHEVHFYFKRVVN